MFLIDKSGSMEGAIEQSKEALSRILAGFPPDKVHIATFDTMGTVLKPKAATPLGGAAHAGADHRLGRDLPQRRRCGRCTCRGCGCRRGRSWW